MSSIDSHTTLIDHWTADQQVQAIKPAYGAGSIPKFIPLAEAVGSLLQSFQHGVTYNNTFLSFLTSCRKVALFLFGGVTWLIVCPLSIALCMKDTLLPV